MRMPDPELVIATYNMLADPYIDPQWYDHTDPADLLTVNRRPRLIERVAGLDADALCLQEVERVVFDLLSLRLEPLGYIGYWAQKARGKPDGCATFIRAPWTCPRSRILTYDDGGAAKASGHVALLTLVERGGCRVLVANTHLKWDSPATPAERKLGLAQARELIATVAREGLPRVACGDFNVESGSEVMQAFAEAGYFDAHDLSAATFNSKGPARKIDYLLHTRALVAHPRSTPHLTASTPLPSASEPSDHLPLVAGFVPSAG